MAGPHRVGMVRVVTRLADEATCLPDREEITAKPKIVLASFVFR